MKYNWSKKMLIFGMTGILAAGLLSGCGGSGGNDSAAAGSRAAEGNTDGSHLNFGCYVYSTSYDPAEYQNAA